MPVVVVTAVAMDGERARCYQHGADAFVTKPIRLATLRQCLVRLYESGRLRPRPGLACVPLLAAAAGAGAAVGGGRGW